MSATLPGIERHPHARAVLSAALPPEGEASHAYLFHGPAGAGKRAVARAFAAALLADGAPDPDNAAARVHHGVHPDLTWVTPSGAAEMLVSDVDEPVVAAAARTPFEARRRVFVIERVDTMHDNAANRLLKTLEEPAPFAHLILLTERPADVLPTIASRCQHVRFDAPSVDEIAQRLESEGVDSAAAQACARLALGDVERARRLALGDGPALRASAQALARGALAGQLAERPWLELLARARALGDAAVAEVETAVTAELEFLPAKERRRAEREGAERAKRAQRRATTAALDHALQLVGLWFRDVACVVDEAQDVVHNSDRLAELRADAQGRAAGPLRNAVAAVDDLRGAFILNPTEELALEALAYRLARELAS